MWRQDTSRAAEPRAKLSRRGLAWALAGIVCQHLTVARVAERLLDMVEGRSMAAFKTWLAERPQAWRDGVEVVAMDGFTGFKTIVAARTHRSTAHVGPCTPAPTCSLTGTAND